MEIPPAFPLVAPSKLCLAALNQLLSSLEVAGNEYRSLMPPQTLRNQRDRFKIWAGNLGALQEGRASLDFRLQESILMQSAVHKLLKQLEKTVISSIEVVRGVRKPLEESLTSADEDEDLWGDSGDESSSDEQEGINTRTELGQNTIAIMQILSDLFRLSFKIRNPATRSSGQSVIKPLLFKQTVNADDTTAVDLLACFAGFDRGHIEEAFCELRRAVHGRPRLKDVYPAYDSLADSDTNETSPQLAASEGPVIEPGEEQHGFLIDRWSRSLTNRRRYFAYWENHALKLAREDKEKAPDQAESKLQDFMKAQPTPMPIPAAALAAAVIIPAAVAPSLAGKSILSGTEVSTYNRKLDDEIDTHSVVSYASTTYDIDGTVADLPQAPPVKPSQTEFQCPYCWVTCPARHSKGKYWREHILRDLQPYMCTYEECSDADALYATRSAWLTHEADVHRRVWRCFGHLEPLFKSQDALQQHLEAEHDDLLGPVQIQEIAKLSHTSTVEQRSVCPFCQSAGPFKKGLANHMAFHMEQLACFAVPRSSGVDNDESSRGSNTNTAHGGLSAASLASALLVFSDASSGKGDGSSSEDYGFMAVAFSPNGRMLASASHNETVKLWDAATGQYLMALEGHSDWVTSVAFSPDGRVLASASHDETIKLWDSATGQCLMTLEGHSGTVTSVAFSPDGRVLASASQDKTIKLWDSATGQHLMTLEGHSGTVWSVAFSPEGKHLASVSTDETVRLWDVATGSHAITLEGHDNRVTSVAFSPDARMLASASKDNIIRLWDMASFQCLRILECFSWNHGEVRIWDIATVQRLLKKGADLNLKDDDGRTPLSWAAEGGDESAVQLLLENGADLESKDEDGRKPLSWAAENGHEGVVWLLLEKGAYLESKDGDDQTLLLWAADYGLEDVV
ncbi:vegetative incompatibility protein HET-E-1 [Colletotrichum spaethianum]|uniref:Vegetative incompatibility protein HET-E-1 n=1 Tax=Colletotrichum spaethianum TaxID=700344 RepID=A0AA37P6A2_9PEZI|nr:vegetative incompatibility protein HET-E-1 [Colletotrichum spaethianum]GKT45906.1 vegetative incompatibility protein HET-E-1 [Colletotrichum spaethianum]